LMASAMPGMSTVTLISIIFQFASLSLFLGQPCFKPLLIFRILVETPNSVKQGGAQHSRISSG
jgi:hypothetical protein